MQSGDSAQLAEELRRAAQEHGFTEAELLESLEMADAVMRSVARQNNMTLEEVREAWLAGTLTIVSPIEVDASSDDFDHAALPQAFAYNAKWGPEPKDVKAATITSSDQSLAIELDAEAGGYNENEYPDDDPEAEYWSPLVGPRGWTVYVPNPFATGNRLIEIGNGVAVPERFSFEATSPQGERVRCAVEVERDGRARVVAVEIVEADGQGVTGLTLARVSFQALLETALNGTHTQRLNPFPWHWFADRSELSDADRAEQDAVHARAAQTIKKATRKRYTPERLEEIAAAYQAGGIKAIQALGFGERHARRLKAICVEKGLLPAANERTADRPRRKATK